MRWILVLVMSAMVGCDRGATSDPLAGEVGAPPPSGLDTLLDLGRGFVHDPERWLPESFLLDPAMWKLTAVEEPVVDLLGLGRVDGNAYVVGDSLDPFLPGGSKNSRFSMYSFDTSWVTRGLSNTSLGSSERRSLIPQLRMRSIIHERFDKVSRSYSKASLRVEDADGDGWLRSAKEGAMPMVRFDFEQSQGGPPYYSQLRKVVMGCGTDGDFARDADNPLFEISNRSAGFTTLKPLDTILFKAHDTIAGAVWNAPNASGILERRTTDRLVQASVTLESIPSFRDLRAVWRNGSDSFWTTTTPTGTGTLNWVGGDGRTDTVRLDLVGREWYRLPIAERHGFISRQRDGDPWSREDLDWTQSAPDPNSFVANGTFRFRRWSRDSGGVWFEGIWSIDQWNQRTYTTKAPGKL